MPIKTNFEIPRSTEDADIVRSSTRMAQDLSKNFKSIKNQFEELSSSILGVDNRIDFSFLGASTFTADYTFAHGLGSVPSGFIVTDTVCSTVSASVTGFVVHRTSWTTNEITVRLVVSLNTSDNGIGSFKIKVLR